MIPNNNNLYKYWFLLSVYTKYNYLTIAKRSAVIAFVSPYIAVFTLVVSFNYQIDFKTAFLYSNIDTKIYVNFLLGFKVKGKFYEL